MSLYGHIIILQNSWFTLEFTHGVIYSMGFNKCILTYIHHCSVIQSSNTVSKELLLPPILGIFFLFSLTNFKVLVFTFRSVIHFKFIVYAVMLRVQVHICSKWICSFSSMIENNLLSGWITLTSLAKLNWACMCYPVDPYVTTKFSWSL